MEDRIEDGLNHVRVLADEIGKRPTGFDGETRAAAYLCDQLTQWGLQAVGTEPFDARSWDFEQCELRCGALGTVPALPIEFSASTPLDGLAGELVVFESPGDIGGKDLRGRVVLVLGSLPDPGLLLDGGAAALILANPEKPLAWHEIYGPGKPLAGKLPMLTLGFGDAVDLLRNSVTNVELHISTTIADVVGHNVVATLPGTGRSRSPSTSAATMTRCQPAAPPPTTPPGPPAPWKSCTP